ncbi:LLM class flavin-dependent oxidoreductase [Paraflavitalea sp. CAU 1676]|uniref:LLM class flavin-dependent oxidoreductase n=1 Tax=Paraflavitalea sp. CAU 1676 TaxID=3032598 RepID=UPI0023DCE057|nr:LLM class flavin-dependent oxidoreductase [Paraflavitalea sp. CAU 1676]MDF2186792.1 LLM class flavin-dependent oxidoreductase [Paraflavitalea sp. CAU 1676]
MELGICTFVDNMPDPVTGKMISGHQRMQHLLDEIELTEQVGLDVFAIGEHHRVEYLVSSPAVVLAAAAARTKRIKLSSGVTVLSSDDPVRVFQDFATVDLLSGGRAEIMAGRGSFIESFPLFGHDLQDYDELFSEKLELLLKLNEQERVTWKGKHRASINNLGVYPRPHQQKLPIWIAVGGTPESVVRAGKLGLPLTLAIIGGEPHRFAPLIQLYRNTYLQSGHAAENLQIGINSHLFIADESQKAADLFFPPYAEIMGRIGRERGWGPMSRQQFEAMRTKRGSLLVGSPQEIIDKILYEYELFQNTRFLAQMSVGSLPHKEMMRSIELFGTEVAPVVRKAVQQQPA